MIQNRKMKNQRPMLKFYPLPYNDFALDPVISADTMRTHHEKHYRGYYDKMLEEMDRLNIQADNIGEMLEGDQWDASEKLAENFGGYLNHSNFWFMLRPVGDTQNPRKETERLMKQDFGSVKKWQEKFTAEAKGRFGSGWTWWAYDPDTGKTSIFSTPNQEFPEMEKYGRQIPLFGLDVWEHAYYLDYKNERGKYIDNVLNDAVNWAYVEARLLEAMAL